MYLPTKNNSLDERNTQHRSQYFQCTVEVDDDCDQKKNTHLKIKLKIQFFKQLLKPNLKKIVKIIQRINEKIEIKFDLWAKPLKRKCIVFLKDKLKNKMNEHI